MFKFMALSGVAVTMLAAAEPAAATTFDYSYTVGAVSVAGSFIAASNTNSQGYRLITALDGKRGGKAIGLLPVGSLFAPFVTDNLVNTTTDEFTIRGIGYSAGGVSYNAQGNGSGSYECASLCTSSLSISNLSIMLAPTATFGFSYTAGGTVVAGTFQATNTANSTGYREIVALNGSRGGKAIRLLPVGAQFTGFATDNQVNTTADTFTGYGIGYSAGGVVYNPFGSKTGNYECVSSSCSYNPAIVNLSLVEILPTAAAVPEPAMWLMMLTGFGIVGGLLRRRNVAGMPSQSVV